MVKQTLKKKNNKHLPKNMRHYETTFEENPYRYPNETL